MGLPKRKQNRLQGYSYNTANAYFITICVKDRKCLLWDDLGPIQNPFTNTDSVPLSPLGRIVNQTIHAIPDHYPLVSVDHYVIMPNHVHLLLRIMPDIDGRSMIAPTDKDGGRSMIAHTVSRVVRLMKGTVTKLAGFSLWQKGFYDHVIRNEVDYLATWNYIDGNPLKWNEDELYLQ